MAKRSTTTRKSKPVKSDKVKADTPDVLLQLRIDTTYKIIGAKTKKMYVFEGAGSTLPVNAEDAKEFEQLGKIAGCCGSAPKVAPIFEKIS